MAFDSCFRDELSGDGEMGAGGSYTGGPNKEIFHNNQEKYFESGSEHGKKWAKQKKHLESRIERIWQNCLE